MKSTRIIVADRYKMVAEGLKSVLNKMEGLEIVGFARGGKELLKVLRKDNMIDLVIMDVTMPELDGIDTMRVIKKKFLDIKVLTYSALNEIEYINSMRIEGAMGYVLKTDEENELINAVTAIIDGDKYFSPSVQEAINNGYDHTAKDLKGDYIGLKKREREIITLIAQERTNDEIADELCLSPSTIKTYRKRLLLKLNVRSSAGLVKYAIDRSWVT